MPRGFTSSPQPNTIKPISFPSVKYNQVSNGGFLTDADGEVEREWNCTNQANSNHSEGKIETFCVVYHLTFN